MSEKSVIMVIPMFSLEYHYHLKKNIILIRRLLLNLLSAQLIVFQISYNRLSFAFITK